MVAVSMSPRHGFSKPASPLIRLVEGLGVEGDAHAGATVQHRSRLPRFAAQPNLRQVHLLHAELFDELALAGFSVGPGDVGDNVATRGLDLLGLPAGTRLRLGARAEVELTGLRNPCAQLDRFQLGLTQAVLERGPDGALTRKCGVMAIVTASGEVRAGDAIAVHLPPGPYRRLEPV